MGVQTDNSPKNNHVGWVKPSPEGIKAETVKNIVAGGLHSCRARLGYNFLKGSHVKHNLFRGKHAYRKHWVHFEKIMIVLAICFLSLRYTCGTGLHIYIYIYKSWSNKNQMRESLYNLSARPISIGSCTSFIRFCLNQLLPCILEHKIFFFFKSVPVGDETL